MSKAFNFVLALAAAAGRAQADAGGGLVVSALFGTEPPPYVHAAVANVLGLSGCTTRPLSGRKYRGTGGTGTRTRPWRAAIGAMRPGSCDTGDTRTRRACIAGRTRGAITQTGSARQLQAARPTAWSWRRQRFLPNSRRWPRCTGRAR
jgi:hypothetical protein